MLANIKNCWMHNVACVPRFWLSEHSNPTRFTKLDSQQFVCRTPVKNNSNISVNLVFLFNRVLFLQTWWFRSVITSLAIYTHGSRPTVQSRYWKCDHVEDGGFYQLPNLKYGTMHINVALHRLRLIKEETCIADCQQWPQWYTGNPMPYRITAFTCQPPEESVPPSPLRPLLVFDESTRMMDDFT